MTLDRLHQRHLAHVGSLSRGYVFNILTWQPSSTLFTFPLLTVSFLQNLVNNTPHASLYLDVMGYVLFSCLSDDNLQPLLSFS